MRLGLASWPVLGDDCLVAAGGSLQLAREQLVGARGEALVLGTDGPALGACLCVSRAYGVPRIPARAGRENVLTARTDRGVGVADLGYCDLAVAFLLWEPRQRG